MTFEDMAEEYARLNARQYMHNDASRFCTSKEEVKQAYLAGLKAGMYDRKREEVAEDELKKHLVDAREIIKSLLPFEHVIDPYALTSDFEENQKRFHEPFRKAKQFLQEAES